MNLSNGFYCSDSFPRTGRPKDDEGDGSPRLTKDAVDRLSLPCVGIDQLVESAP